jgi:hypothetical protein
MVSDRALVGKDAVSRSETKRLSNGCGARVLRTSQSERVTRELEMPTMDAPPRQPETQRRRTIRSSERNSILTAAL